MITSTGGETAFPKGNEGLGFKVRQKKGNAVLFYNLLGKMTTRTLTLTLTLSSHRLLDIFILLHTTY